MNTQDAAAQPCPKTQHLFKPKPRQEVNLINVQNALRTLSEVNQHAFESFITHCSNRNCSMSYAVIQFISQSAPLLCSRRGEVPQAVRNLTLQVVNYKDNKPYVKDDASEPALQPSPN